MNTVEESMDIERVVSIEKLHLSILDELEWVI